MNKISVIIPVYNVADYLEKCLDSLVKQTNHNFEVIIVNDGSTDNSDEIINKYVLENQNFKSFYKKNGGQASARNYGIKKASGEYILFLDGDDYYETNAIETLLKHIDNDDDIIVFKMLNDYDGKIEKGTIAVDIDIDDNNRKYLISNPSPCDKLFKKTLFTDNNVMFIQNRYYEDLGTIPLLTMYTKKIKFIDEYLYYYVQRIDSTMNKIKYNRNIEDIFFIIHFLQQHFLDEGEYEKYKSEIEFIYIHHFLRAAGIRFLNYDRYDMIDKIRDIMKKDYPNFTKNKYFKKYSFKQKIMCRLLYNGNYNIIKFLRR